MAFNVSVGMVFLNVISLVYMYLQPNFVRLEFKIVYALNSSFSILILIYAFLDHSKNPYVCQSAILFYYTFIYITIKKEIEIGFTVYKEISGKNIIK